MKITLILSTIVALINGQSRVIGGSEAAVGQRRYISRLIGCENGSVNCDWICGGNLIAPNAILTAAHCVIDEYPVKWVVIGSHFSTPNNDTAADGVKVRVVQAIRHPQYDLVSPDMSNDVAILLLGRNITTIQPIQVSFENVPKDILTWARGWGTTSLGGYTSDTLLEVQLRTWSNRDAARVYKTLGYTDPETNTTITATMLPAGGVEGKDTCNGDSGGPLTIESSYSSAKLVGLTSWGHDCALKGVPGLYSRISAFKDFITSHCKQSDGKARCTDCNFAQCYK